MAIEILWLALFLLVVAISFILALRSMSDFGETPSQGREYGLFLMRKPQSLTPSFLDTIHKGLAKEGQIMVLERLFKGRETALVIFGPVQLLTSYLNELNLLQLEDYTSLPPDQIQAWEMALRNGSQAEGENPFTDFPELLKTEQFFFQLILRPKSAKGEKIFLGQIRAVFFSPDSGRRKKLTADLQNLKPLTKIPRLFSSAQIFDFYVMRRFFKGKFNLNLGSSKVCQLMLLLG